jgi:hypothetical protein
MNGKRTHLPWEICATTGSYSVEVSKRHISSETSSAKAERPHKRMKDCMLELAKTLMALCCHR